MKSQLSIKGFGLAAGVLWGITLLLFPLFADQLGLGVAFYEVLLGSYPGYDGTVGGSILGGILGFIDAGIGGAIFAWLYNKLA